MNTPVVLFVFSRPALARRLIDALRPARPASVYVVSDGPRNEAERADCLAARAEISRIDWTCDVKIRDTEVNQGINATIKLGAAWVFETWSRAIFLEDDCIPDPSFFRFCDELLARHEDDTRVTQICGHNRLFRWKHQEQSYHFGFYGISWGWATWRRAWDLMTSRASPQGESESLARIESLLANAEEFRYFCSHRERARNAGVPLTWDYEWAFAQVAQGGLTVTPAVNLVANVGFGPSAAHTRRRPPGLMDESEALAFPLRAPVQVGRDPEFDHQFWRWAIGDPGPGSSMSMAERLLERGRDLEALLLVDRLYRRDPMSVATATVRARALLALGRPDEARRSIRAIQERHQNHDGIEANIPPSPTTTHS